MNREDELLDLMVDWDLAQQEGRDLSPEALAPSDLEMQQLLRSAIAAHRQFQRALAPTGPADDDGTIPEGLPVVQGYRIVEVLGSGGMGTVYKAHDDSLGRLVAIKMLQAGIAAAGTARARFIREARSVAAIRDPHVVTIHAVDESSFAPFIVMELLEGQPLDRWMQTNRATPKQIVHIGLGVARGLHAAHSLGLLHRDVKPGNIWLERTGRVKLLDFGLARSIDDEARVTGSNLIPGTPAYMAPEQARGLTLDYRCDIYSLGAVLYELATRRRPYLGKDPYSILMSMAVDVPPAITSLNADVPASLANLIHHMIRKSPEERPASALEVADLFGKLSRDEPVTIAAPAAPVPEVQALPDDSTAIWSELDDTQVDAVPVPPSTRPRRQRPGWLLAMVLAAMVVVVTAVLVMQRARKPTIEQQPPGEPVEPSPAQPITPPASIAGPALIDVGPPLRPNSILSLDHLTVEQHVPAGERRFMIDRSVVGIVGTHANSVPSTSPTLTLSPDGNTLLLHADGVRASYLLDLRTGKQTSLAIAATDFMPDSRRLQYMMTAFDPQSPEKGKRDLNLPTQPSAMLADDLALMAGESGYRLVRFDAVSREVLFDWPTAIASTTSPDRQWLGVLNHKGELAICRVRPRPTLVGTLRGLNPKARLHCSNDRILVVRADGVAGIWRFDRLERDPVTTLEGKFDEYNTLAISQDGTTIWQDGKLLDCTNGGPRLLAETTNQWTARQSLVIAPGNRSIITWRGGRFYWWDVRGNEIVPRATPTSPYFGISDAWIASLSSDGRWLCTRLSEPAQTDCYGVIDLKNWKVHRLAPAVARPWAGFTPDSRWLIINAARDTDHYEHLLIDLASPDLPTVGKLAMSDTWQVHDVSPDGQNLLILDRTRPVPEMVVADARWKSREVVERMRIAAGSIDNDCSMVFVGLGQQVLVRSRSPDNADYQHWSLTARGLKPLRQSASSKVTGVPGAFRLGDSHTISAGDPFRITNLHHGKANNLEIKNRRLSGNLSVGPDGRLLAIVTRELDHAERFLLEVVHVWTGQAIRAWELPIAQPRAVFFHPDGRHLLVLMPDETIHVMRLMSRETMTIARQVFHKVQLR